MQALWICATILLLIMSISAAPQDQLLVEEPSYVIISTTSLPEEASEEDLKTSYTVHSSDRQKRSTEDDLNGSASAIVFRPLFVYRQQRQSRRRVTRDVADDTKHLEKRETPETSGREKRSLDSSDDLSGSNSGIVFRPLFAYRQQRQSKRRVTRDTADDSKDIPQSETAEDVLETSERQKRSSDDLSGSSSGIVFRPLFAYRQQRQSRRRVTRDTADDSKDIPESETAEDVLETSERQKRSSDLSDDLTGSNSGIVFRPLFAYRQQRQSRRRVTRDTADDTKDIPKSETAEDLLETSERQKRSSDDLSGSSSGIVFRPLFAYRQQRQSRRRVTRDVADDTKDLPKREPAEDVLETSERQKRFSDLSDDLSGSNSGIVFRPLFAYRQQRQSRRRVTRDITDDSKDIPKSETAEDLLETSERQKRSSDDLSGSSSGIVFRPLFAYRQQRQSRRRVTRDITDDSKDIPKSETAEDLLETSERQKRSSDDLSGSSSGIVFRPLFAYRQQRQSRRRVTRDVPSYLSEDSNNLEDLEASYSDLVFRPLFTYREELKEKEAYDNYNKDYAFDYEDDESRSKRSLYGLSSDAENFDGYNSGIVSRPLFAYPYQKQIRREITRENNEGRKKRSVEEYESKEGKSADLKDLKAEESGNLVYKPVFRYKYRYVESRSGKRKT